MAPRPERNAFFLPLARLLLKPVIMNDSTKLRITDLHLFDPHTAQYIAVSVTVSAPMSTPPMLLLWRSLTRKHLVIDALATRLRQIDRYDLMLVLWHPTAPAGVFNVLRRLMRLLHDQIVIQQAQKRDQEPAITLLDLQRVSGQLRIYVI